MNVSTLDVFNRYAMKCFKIDIPHGVFILKRLLIIISPTKSIYYNRGALRFANTFCPGEQKLTAYTATILTDFSYNSNLKQSETFFEEGVIWNLAGTL